MRPIIAALLASAVIVPCAHAEDLRHFEDAALHAVQFVDRDEGWAVGDEGVVWHSIDGGKTWERQPTGVRSSLRSLCFLNPYVGWVVGREELPNGAGSTGVLLFTQDGGLKWQQFKRNTMPGLNVVRFLDAKTGFVVGDGSDQFPTGVFTTTDSGRTWQPIAGPRCPGWLAAEFVDAQTGSLVGAWSRLATFQKGALGAADVDTLGGRDLRSVYLNGKQAVAVGQGGAVLVSDTGGVRWGYADLKLPTEVRAGMDFHGVHGQGNHVWVVGRPGSAILHSGDRGQKWELLTTGQPLPLNGVFFTNDQRGWVVGEFGSILGTEDGGKTWKVQRRGGQRAAVLFVHSRPTSLPVDTIALLGGQDGYLTTAVRVNAVDPASASPKRASDTQRWTAAVNKVGGAAGEMFWDFPLPQHLAGCDKNELLKAWDRLHGDRGAEQFLRQLVLTIRIWKPAVIITDNPDPTATASPADALVAEAVHEAFRRAADPKLFPEQLDVLGLEAWQASKLYSCWETRNGSQVTIDTNEPNSRFESTLRDFAAPAAELLADAPAVLPGQRFYRLLASTLEGATNHHDLMEGIALAPGGLARRELVAFAEPKPEVLKAIRTRRNLLTMAEAPPTELTDPEKLVAQLGPALSSLPDDQASEAAFSIASQYARMGQWTLAREVYLFMVDRYPAHPRAADAYRWLIRYNCSSEARRRQELGQFLMVSNLGFQRDGTLKVDPKTMKSDASTGTAKEIRERSLSLLGDRSETRLWNQGCLDIGARLQAFGPLFATDPSMNICLNAARRNLGQFEAAREWYSQFRNEQADGPWKDAAATELWLVNRNGLSPKPSMTCRQTSQRPYLDGKFDDPCWQGIKPVVLKSAAGDTAKDYVTEVMMTYDNDFLYLALKCQHPAGMQVSPVKTRRHDADLTAFDRVSLILDLDRDYASYFHLQVDQRGCVYDECGITGSGGDRTWNPRWFVAVRSEATVWQIEAAIPMIELSGDTVTPGKTWACNLVRVLPGRGVQALSTPADVQPRPEGMGLLMFISEASAKQTPLHAN